MNYSWLILLLFVHCAHSLSFQFAATQSPGHYGENTISATCDQSRKCALDTSSRSTCERWGCCFQNNECFAKKYFIINQGPPKTKAPLFTVVFDDGSPLETTRAEALKYCQNNFPNGQLPVPTATADWLTLAGRTEKFKDVLNSIPSYMHSYFVLHLHVDYDHVSDDVTTIDGQFVAKGADFENSLFRPLNVLNSLAILPDFKIVNGYPEEMGVVCQHD